jgi:hypothetical protein
MAIGGAKRRRGLPTVQQKEAFVVASLDVIASFKIINSIFSSVTKARALCRAYRRAYNAWCHRLQIALLGISLPAMIAFL